MVLGFSRAKTVLLIVKNDNEYEVVSIVRVASWRRES